MKTAYRLSLTVLLSALPSLGQGGWQTPTPFENPRAPWSSLGTVVSAEHATPEAAAGRPVFEPPRPGGQAPRPASDTVSITRLTNAPPAKAVKEVQKATKAIEEGDREKAIEHYERAVEIFPEYVEAYNNLGVQCLRLGRVQQAVSVLERAVELDPASVEPHLNLAVALHTAGELDAAARQATLAVELAPQSASANLGLGMVLVAQGRNLEEAVRRLQFASSEHPGAALAAADALLQLGKANEAHVALRSFLNRKPD